MNILFIGAEIGTAEHRAQAMRRLGHKLHVVDADQFVPKHRILAKLQYESGSLLFQKRVTAQVLKAIEGVEFDVAWVESGRGVGPRLIEQLHRHGPVINNMSDDPFGNRDRFSWQLFLRAVPHYDLIIVPRIPNIAEAYRMGAKQVVRYIFPIDEVAHAPRPLTPEDHARWDSDVLFAGTWMPERGPFLAELIQRGVPLTIHGNRWQKAKEWPILQKAWKPSVDDYDDYAKVIQCAKICLGLLSKGNRDLHTRRSSEVPCLGSLLCAERTSEHQEMYVEGVEAVFWSDAAECARICLELLADDERRRAISRAGRERFLRDGHLNEPMIREALDLVMCK